MKKEIKMHEKEKNIILTAGKEFPAFNISRNRILLDKRRELFIEPELLFHMYVDNRLTYNDLCSIYKYSEAITQPTMNNLILNLYDNKITLKDIENTYLNNTEYGGRTIFKYAGDIMIVMPDKKYLLRLMNSNSTNLPIYLGRINFTYDIYYDILSKFFIDEVINKNNTAVLDKTQEIVDICQDGKFESLLYDYFIGKKDISPILKKIEKNNSLKENFAQIQYNLRNNYFMPVGQDGYVCQDYRNYFFISREENPRLYSLKKDSAIRMITAGKEKHYKKRGSERNILDFINDGPFTKIEMLRILNKINDPIYDPIITLLNI